MIKVGFGGGFRKIGFDSSIFDPVTLFADGKQGVFYDPSKLSSLWQNAARTIPVTADGDPVGCMDDLSGNSNHATQSVSVARPIYKTDGILHWLQFDGVDDYLKIKAFQSSLSQPYFSSFGVTQKDVTTLRLMDSTSSTTRLALVAIDGIFYVNTGGSTASKSNPLVINSPSVFTLIARGVSSSMRHNSISTSVSTGTTSANNLAIGTNSLLSAQGAFDLYSVVIASYSVDDDVVIVENYTADKAGVTL